MKNNQTAIVFGGSGFLGSHVADALNKADFKVRIFDIQESPYLMPDQKMIVGDIMDLDKVRKALDDCQIVYNFAGLADVDDANNRPIESVKLNVLGNVNILEAAKEARVNRFIFASTIYVYSEAGSFYRASKQSSERFVEAYHERYGLPYTIVRYGSLYGPRADMRNGIYRLLRMALVERKIVYPGNRDALREYIHTEDAADASVAILDQKYENQHVILTGQERMKVYDVMSMIAEMLPYDVELDFQDCKQESKTDPHYTITPYSFNPKLGKKLVSNYHVDIGQGLLQCMAELSEKLQRGLEHRGDWLVTKNAK